MNGYEVFYLIACAGFGLGSYWLYRTARKFEKQHHE